MEKQPNFQELSTRLEKSFYAAFPFQSKQKLQRDSQDFFRKNKNDFPAIEAKITDNNLKVSEIASKSKVKVYRQSSLSNLFNFAGKKPRKDDERPENKVGLLKLLVFNGGQKRWLFPLDFFGFFAFSKIRFPNACPCQIFKTIQYFTS